MSTKKSGKTTILLYTLFIIAGCFLAFSSIITNDYLKLVIVLVSFGVGLFGLMKSLSNSGETRD